MAETGEQILRITQVADKVSMSRSWVRAEAKAGRFPRGVQITERAVGWIASEVDDWIRDLRRKRQDATQAEG